VRQDAARTPQSRKRERIAAPAAAAAAYLEGVNPRRPWVAALAFVTVWCGLRGAGRAVHGAPLRTTKAVDEAVLVERGLAIVRLDPKPGAPPGECDDLKLGDVTVLVGGRQAPVTAVERVARPERHWIVLDVSESAEGRRQEAKRSALQYVREVMVPGVDSAAIVTIDEDAILVEGPTTDTDRLARAIEGVPAGGSSALWDGLDIVLRQIEGDRHEHLVLFWTDGLDNDSVSREPDLVRTISRVPQATVFPLALLPPGTREIAPRAAMLQARHLSRDPILGEFLFEAATRTGGEVFASSDPRWLDRVRGWIARRFTVSFSGEWDSANVATVKKGLVLATPGKRCSVTTLPDPFERPDAVAGQAPPEPDAWVRAHERLSARERLNGAPGFASTGPRDGPLEIVAGGVEGYVLDMVEAPGPVVHRRTPVAATSSTGRFVARKVKVAASEIGRLPESFVDAFDQLIPGEDDDPNAPSPLQMEGAAFLTQRARIAASLFAFRPDYRDFALARLARDTEDDLRAIERDFSRAFPDLPAGKIAEIARASRAGQRAIEASRTPTDADLARVLAVWLRDVRARDLFLDWEKKLCDARIVGGPEGTAFARWTALRARLGYPWPTRIVAPLVLLHDPVTDRLGFVRIALPRPEGPVARGALSPGTDLRSDDRVAPTPLGLWLLDRVASGSEIGKVVASRGYRTRSITYAPVIPPTVGRAGRPAHRERVTVLLAPPESPSTLLTLDADIDTPDDGAPILVRLDPTVAGDPELAALVEPLQVAPRPDGLTPPATPQRSSRPRRAPCCGRRRGSSRARGARG
jgi:hypothetical protein